MYLPPKQLNANIQCIQTFSVNIIITMKIREINSKKIMCSRMDHKSLNNKLEFILRMNQASNKTTLPVFNINYYEQKPICVLAI